MIVDGILLVFKGLLQVLLAPLSIINIAIDFFCSFSTIQQFLQIIVFIMPWQYILPLIVFIVSIFGFRILMSIIKLVLDFIPFE